jgi:hypothetical protein
LLVKTTLTKADYWSYEREWRLLGPEAGGQTKAFSSDLLDGVIFGARASDATRKLVEDWISNRSTRVELLEARFDQDHFRLDIAPVR